MVLSRWIIAVSVRIAVLKRVDRGFKCVDRGSDHAYHGSVRVDYGLKWVNRGSKRLDYGFKCVDYGSERMECGSDKFGSWCLAC